VQNISESYKRISIQRLRFGWPIADIVRFTNASTYLLSYLMKVFGGVGHVPVDGRLDFGGD